PLLLRWHRFLLLATWNGCAVLYFLPGRPDLFFAIAWLSFLISILQFIIHPRSKFLSVPSVGRPLLCMALVVIATAEVNGGIGFGALGSETMGGKKYLLMLTAVAAFFALISQPIPPAKARFYTLVFLLSYLTYAIGDVAPLVGANFYFIFWLFPMSGQSV